VADRRYRVTGLGTPLTRRLGITIARQVPTALHLTAPHRVVGLDAER
jgi:hypothetical protein